MTKIDDSIYEIIANGITKNEGIIFTTDRISGEETIVVELEVNGESNLIMKVSETAVNGRFIQESISKPFALIGSWQKIQFKTTLDSATSQIDVLVLINEKKKTKTLFRDAKIIIKEQNKKGRQIHSSF